ncbi:hypothetical protein [Notoacmeibacter sp. MSK16QG-6]|uniref:hypothetical protein n=1 Tax=Notoacmeibacter sp. MSK16QG-6 TaxID=2957982 RepID=UPI0020A1CFC2|nr:hypothetical protein [Notoacmeibacter sp. MSK16QG-6]MCP1198932.1 hypothetical protein [Notoacmeibacter sp. MSK16QG-6]
MHLDRIAQASLATLIILQTVMFASLLAGVAPHPPAIIPFAGMGPFLGLSLSLAVGALLIGPRRGIGIVLTGLACLMALVSFGPQKFFDPAFPLVWPAVLGGQAAVITLGISIFAKRDAFDQ